MLWTPSPSTTWILSLRPCRNPPWGIVGAQVTPQQAAYVQVVSVFVSGAPARRRGPALQVLMRGAASPACFFCCFMAFFSFGVCCGFFLLSFGG